MHTDVQEAAYKVRFQTRHIDGFQEAGLQRKGKRENYVLQTPILLNFFNMTKYCFQNIKKETPPKKSTGTRFMYFSKEYKRLRGESI